MMQKLGVSGRDGRKLQMSQIYWLQNAFLALENAFSSNLGGEEKKFFLLPQLIWGLQETLYQVPVF